MIFGAAPLHVCGWVLVLQGFLILDGEIRRLFVLLALEVLVLIDICLAEDPLQPWDTLTSIDVKVDILDTVQAAADK